MPVPRPRAPQPSPFFLPPSRLPEPKLTTTARASRGQEFGNACLAKCAGYDTFTDGPCSYNSGVAVSAPGAPKWRPACPCPFDWRPVCASADGGKSFRTFGNECAAKCVSAVVKTKGECYAEVVPDDNLDGVADAGAAPPVKRLSAPDETPGAGGWGCGGGGGRASGGAQLPACERRGRAGECRGVRAAAPGRGLRVACLARSRAPLTAHALPLPLLAPLRPAQSARCCRARAPAPR